MVVKMHDSPRKWASADTWERHRDEITKLYRSGTLKDVIEHMERVYGFSATERMYKFRIKCWGLNKNWKEDRVKRVLQSLETEASLEDDEPDKSPLGRLQAGQLRRLQHYFKRKPTTLEELQQGHKHALDILLGQRSSIEVSTKDASSPAPKRLRVLALSPSTPRGPSQVEAPDEIFRLLRVFLDSLGRDSGSRSGNKHPKQDERMLEFVLKFRLAHDLILENHHEPAFLCLSVCFEFLSAMLLPKGQPMTFLYVLNAALEVSNDFVTLPEILSLLFRHLRGLSEIRLGPTHPASEIARRFGVLDGQQCRTVLGIMRRLRMDSARSAASACGRGYMEVAFSVYDKTVEVWSAGRHDPSVSPGTKTSYVCGLQRLLTEWELVHQSYIMTLWLRMRLAIAMLDEEDEFGLEAVGQMLRREYPAELLIPLREPARLSLVLQCYKIRGYMWLKEGMVENAEYMFRMGKVLADTTWGSGCDVGVGFAEDAKSLASGLAMAGPSQ